MSEPAAQGRTCPIDCPGDTCVWCAPYNLATASPFPLPWMDESLSRESRLEAALLAIRDNTPHVEDTDTYCPACLAAVALDPTTIHGAESRV